MQLMMLEAPGTDAYALARDVVEHFGIPSIVLTAGKPEDWTSILAQELKQPGRTEGFLLLVDLQSPEQAATLESILGKWNRPLELVISIDTAPDPSLAESPSGYNAGVCDYYRQRGLLRRIRGEGSAPDLLATINRIVNDMNRAQQAPNADPFSAKLRAIADAAPTIPAEPLPAEPAATDALRRPIPAVPESVDSREKAEPVPGWKRTAEQKGRIRRRTGAGKKGFGGYKPGGSRKP